MFLTRGVSDERDARIIYLLNTDTRTPHATHTHSTYTPHSTAPRHIYKLNGLVRMSAVTALAVVRL